MTTAFVQKLENRSVKKEEDGRRSPDKQVRRFAGGVGGNAVDCRFDSFGTAPTFVFGKKTLENSVR